MRHSNLSSLIFLAALLPTGNAFAATEPGPVIVIGGGFRSLPMSIHFAKRATGVAAADRARLAENVRAIEAIGRKLKYGKPCVFVQGVADASEGTKRQQWQLSLERAQAVGELLQRYGMPEGYIFLDAKGGELRFFLPPDLRNAVVDIEFLLC